MLMISTENANLNEIYSKFLIKFKFKVHYFVSWFISYIFLHTIQIFQGVLMERQRVQFQLACRS